MIANDVTVSDCQAVCCNNRSEVYQPKTDKDFAKNGRNFMVAWYSKHPWITLCLTKKKVFCIFCRYARLHKTLLFSTKYNDPFFLEGYDYMKKALVNFQAYYITHGSWNLSRRQSIAQQLNSESYKQHDSRRNGLLHSTDGNKVFGFEVSRSFMNIIIFVFRPSLIMSVARVTGHH